MIETAQGNLLAADVDALVNTVNTVGVMGKGIALQFRRAYPQMFEEYKRACAAGDVAIGQMHVWPTDQLNGPRYIINFPTKRHWRGGSKLEYIDQGLRDLVHVIESLEIESIAIPPLGAGNGGLPWPVVRPRIVEALNGVPDLRVFLYEPGAPPAAREMAGPAEPRRLTKGRAALIALLGGYLSSGAIGASLIEVQKLMYFLQEAGEPLRLRFAANRYGPYADNLRHVLRELEGSYLTGYGDGSARVMEAEPIELLPNADSAASEILDQDPGTVDRIERVLELVEGFDSMYGTELLATVHWVATREVDAAHLDAVTNKVQTWSRRKQELFTARHVAIALEHLSSLGWLRAA